jgi:predicted nucleic acid-binding protein
MGKDVQTMSEAWELWDSVWSDERISFVSEPEGFENEFRSRTRVSAKSPKVWADAYVVTFAALLRLKLVTFDRALQERGVEVLLL